MPDFTKGKWEMKFEYDYDDNPPAYKIFSTFDTKYDVMEETIGYAYEENDARLIASAPEMYYELHNLLEYLYGIQSEGFMLQTQEDINRVEALLARIDSEEDQI